MLAQRENYARALAELHAGRKRSHWIWYVFPQLAGLGRSATARHYAIADLDEARAYLDHPVLGPRLVEASEALLAWQDRSAEDILGKIDALKLQSAMTLFERAGGAAVFAEVLEAFYDGQRDEQSLALLEAD